VLQKAEVSALQPTKPDVYIVLGDGGEAGTPEGGVVAASQPDGREQRRVPVEDHAITVLPELPATEQKERRRGPPRDVWVAGRV
jgi:hypothetical protein